MAISSELFNILKSEADEEGKALSWAQSGDNPADMDGSGNVASGLVGFSFRDSSGNLVLPSLNPEGAVPVTLDAGTTLRTSDSLLSGSQTKDTRAQLGSLSLTAEKNYTKMSAQVSCSRLSLFEMVYVDDAAGTPAETVIGYAIVGAGNYNEQIALTVDVLSTVGGTGNQELQIFHTPLDKESDAFASWSANEIA